MGEVIQLHRKVIICGSCMRTELLPYGLANMIEHDSDVEDRECLDCFDARIEDGQ